MIEKFRIFEKAESHAKAFTELPGKKAVALMKHLQSEKHWRSYNVADLEKVEAETGIEAGEFISMKITVGDDPVAIKAMQSAYIRAKKANTWREAIKESYKSDDDIRSEFAGMKVHEFSMPGKFDNKMLGMIALEFPDGEESVAGGSTTAIEHFLYNEETGEFKIAFENWFPEDVCDEIIKTVSDKIKEATGKQPKQIRYAAEWDSAKANIRENAEGFTDGRDLNDVFRASKEKYGEKQGSKYNDVVNRLVNPNENRIIEVRSNGVVVKENGKYLLKPFTNTDAHFKKWELGRALDVTEQYTQEDAGKTADAIMKKYKENEAANNHSENIVLLAKHFGSKEDLENAKELAKKAERAGHLPQDVRAEQDKIHKRLYKVLTTMSKKP